jgi:hypothetical protein
MPMRPLALTDNELAALMNAARVLQPQQRDTFVRIVAHRVQDTCEVQGVVERVLRELLHAPERLSHLSL